MYSTIYYATVGQVQDFIKDRLSKDKTVTPFPEALIQLQKRQQLSTQKLPFPPFHDNMSDDEFNSMIRAFPFNASQIIDHYSSLPELQLVDENEMIPFGKDVFCVKNVSNVDETPHWHDYFEIFYAFSGSFKLVFEHESITLVEGDLCILSPKSTHSMLNVPDRLIMTIIARKSTFDAIFGSLMFNKSLISLFFRNALYNGRQSNYLLLRTGPSPALRRTVQQLAYESNRDDPYANACSIGLLNLFLAQAMREYSDTIRMYNLENFTEKSFDFALILQYIQQNYRTVTLASLAKAFHFSEAYLSKLIMKNLGQGFSSVIRNLKMMRSTELLVNTPMKISEIAEQVGYESVDHFSRTFKKVYEISPHEYKLQNAKRDF
jgi:AraC-like DNA-binding protein/mannose-6-phosphate isomerase-like protein (cupin superfamily)